MGFAVKGGELNVIAEASLSYMPRIDSLAP